MRLQLRCHGDIDLSQPGMQVEIRSHIARCLRDYPNGGEGVITLAGVEHCFMYVVQNDVVDSVLAGNAKNGKPTDTIPRMHSARRRKAPRRSGASRLWRLARGGKPHRYNTTVGCEARGKLAEKGPPERG